MYTVKHKDDRPFMQRELGTADGLSRDFTWGKGNKHEVAMSDRDAEKLMQSDDADEFEFTKAGSDVVVTDDEGDR